VLRRLAQELSHLVPRFTTEELMHLCQLRTGLLLRAFRASSTAASIAYVVQRGGRDCIAPPGRDDFYFDAPIWASV